jgi:hypothetical protein
MGLSRIKKPIEYSFHQWISAHPESRHWADKERFYTFVRTVCRYHSKKWKDQKYLKDQILARRPKFDPEYLDHILDQYLELIEFSKVFPITSDLRIENGLEVKRGYCIEREVVNGKVVEREVPLQS